MKLKFQNSQVSPCLGSLLILTLATYVSSLEVILRGDQRLGVTLANTQQSWNNEDALVEILPGVGNRNSSEVLENNTSAEISGEDYVDESASDEGSDSDYSGEETSAENNLIHGTNT